MRPTSCSGFGVWGSYSTTGNPIVGRNLDWVDFGILKKYNSLLVYRNSTKNKIALSGYLGFILNISGYNEKGLSISILDSSIGDTYSSLNKDSYPFKIRAALENEYSIPGATTRLTNGNYAFSFNLFMADTNTVNILEMALTNNYLRNDLDNPTLLKNATAAPCSNRIWVANHFEKLNIHLI